MYKRSSIIETIEKVETQFSMKEEGLEYYNKKTQPLIFLGSTLMLLYNSLIVMLGYNWIIPKISLLSRSYCNSSAPSHTPTHSTTTHTLRVLFLIPAILFLWIKMS